MPSYNCNNCLFWRDCPCSYSYNNSVCLTIQSKYPSLSERINEIREIFENDDIINTNNKN